MDVEEAKKHRFSAVINGMCMGMGLLFLMMGILLPLLMPHNIVQALIFIIVGIVSIAAGMGLEAYHWAKLH